MFSEHKLIFKVKTQNVHVIRMHYAHHFVKFFFVILTNFFAGRNSLRVGVTGSLDFIINKT